MSEELTLEQLIVLLKDRDANVRYDAWQRAGEVGAAAVEPLAALFAEMDAEVERLKQTSKKDELGYKLEVGRAAKRGLWRLVRHVGRPGADDERKAVAAALCDLLGNERPAAVRREVLWMLSEIGDEQAVAAIREIPDVLYQEAIREDARCTVERIPGEAAVQALEEGLDYAPEDFRPALAQSLRKRGVDVPGLPCRKLVPTKQTEVEPVK